MAAQSLIVVKSPKTKAVLAFIVRKNFKGREHNFVTAKDRAFQLGINFYKPGEIIRSHRHVAPRRVIRGTQEFLLVAEGSLTFFLYDESDRLVYKTVLNEHDCVLLAGGGHGFKIRAKKTKLVEIKQGPFFPDRDKIYLRSQA